MKRIENVGTVTGLTLIALSVYAAAAVANPDKARTDYNKCLAQLATEQRKIDQVMDPAKSRCDNTGVCVEITIGAGIGPALSRADAFAKGEECMGRLDTYESACAESGADCTFKTFDEIYKGE